MPKGKRKPQAGTRLPSLRGVIVVDEYNGKPRTRAWPRPRGGNRNETNQYWSRWLKAITYLWRYQTGKIQDQLMRATEGTPWMPRDPFISGARGRAWSFTDQNGRTYYPMPARQAVSQSLDAIAQIAGSMLYRAASGWAAVEPGLAGQVLTNQGPDAAPAWGPGGGGLSASATFERVASLSTSNQTVVPIPWDTVISDPDGFLDASTPTDIIIPTGFAGLYLIVCTVYWDITATASYEVRLFDVGANTTVQATRQRMQASGGTTATLSVAVSLAEGAAYRLTAYRDGTISSGDIESSGRFRTRLTLLKLS